LGKRLSNDGMVEEQTSTWVLLDHQGEPTREITGGANGLVALVNALRKAGALVIGKPAGVHHYTLHEQDGQILLSVTARVYVPDGSRRAIRSNQSIEIE